MKNDTAIPEGLTRDSVFEGRLTVYQPASGYRFSIDAPLLADFVRCEPGQTVVELGAGAGVVSIIIASVIGSGRVIAVELQDRLAECARLNINEFKNAHKSDVDLNLIKMDWSDLSNDAVGGPVDVVISNPPYRKLGSGRINPGREEAVARHEIMGGADSAAGAAAKILSAGGRLAMIYPSSRLAGLIADLKAHRFEPKRLRMIHSRRRESARLVLIEARIGGKEELEILPPLFIYGDGREYSEEVSAILSGRPFDGPGEPSAVL